MRILFLIILIYFGAITTQAQKRPPKEKNKQTRENAVDIKAAQRKEREVKYLEHKEHLRDIQDKSTKKRMKKNLKRAQKHSQGKSIPWYKRLFRKRKL